MKVDLKVRNNVAYVGVSANEKVETTEDSEKLNELGNRLINKLDPHFDDVILIIGDEINLFGEVSE